VANDGLLVFERQTEIQSRDSPTADSSHLQTGTTIFDGSTILPLQCLSLVVSQRFH
jgi:hypothetical protein